MSEATRPRSKNFYGMYQYDNFGKEKYEPVVERQIELVDISGLEGFKGIVLHQHEALKRSGKQLHLVLVKTCVHNILADLRNYASSNSVKKVHGICLGISLFK